MRKPAPIQFALVVAAVLQSSASYAAEADTFPPQLHGVWNPVPHDCGSLDDGNDLRFEVSAGLRMNHEDVETLVETAELPGSPEAWRLTTTSNVVGSDEGQPRIYVLGRKYLFVTDGDRMDQYVQCR